MKGNQTMVETLNELTDKYQRLAQIILDIDADDEAIQTTLADLNDAIEEKADGYAVIISKLKEELNYANEKAKKWSAKQKSLKQRIAFLKENLQHSMETTGKTKFKTTDWSFWIQKNQPKLIVNEEDLPASYFKEIYVPDNEKIKNDLKKSKAISGAKLVSSESVRIR